MNKSDKEFYCFETEQEYDLGDIKELDSDTQKSIMRDWFYANYENPAEHTPFESSEGGYIYIWGGPFYAKDVLDDVFSNYASEDAIDELVSELDIECSEWSGKISSEGYDDYFYTAIYDNYEFTENLKNNLNSIKELLMIDLQPELKQHMNKMLFVNVITTLETFLSDAFIGKVLNNEKLLKDFVRLNPEFAKQKFTLNEIFERMDNIENEVKKYLLNLTWHNLLKVEKIYKSVLNIEFHIDKDLILKAIFKRHDIVHRNGKTKSGTDVSVTRDELIELMDEVNSFAETIDDFFNI